MQTLNLETEHPRDARIGRAFRRHRDRLRVVVSGAGIGSGEADDVVQEAFVVLAGRLGDVPERAERSFLVSTALRLASDRRRSAWHQLVRVRNDEDPCEALTGDRPDASYERAEGQRRIARAAWAMPEEERQVFLLFSLEGLSRAEVAFILDLPPGTVASRFARARRRFEAALRHHPEAALCADLVQPSPWVNRVVGDRLLCTNPWGSHKVPGWFDQRLLERTRGEKTELGWYFHFPGLDHSGLAFPEMVMGWKPWVGGATSDARFPRPLSTSRNLTVDYDAEVRTTGLVNLAISTWLCKPNAYGFTPNPGAINSEVVVWNNYASSSRPFGRFEQMLRLGDRTYELWCDRQYGKDDKPGGWTIVTLRPLDVTSSGTLPLGSILWELARSGFVSLDDEMMGVEFGTEVLGGAGSAFVREFSATI